MGHTQCARCFSVRFYSPARDYVVAKDLNVVTSYFLTVWPSKQLVHVLDSTLHCTLLEMRMAAWLILGTLARPGASLVSCPPAMWSTRRLGVPRTVRMVLSAGVPNIIEIETVDGILQVHEKHAHTMSPGEVSTCWNTLGKLVRNEGQRCWLDEELRQGSVLQPLLETTLQVLPRFKAWPVANTARGLATLARRTGFVPGEAVWDAVAARSLQIVGDFNSQGLQHRVGVCEGGPQVA